jgi:hypothetical protein
MNFMVTNGGASPGEAVRALAAMSAAGEGGPPPNPSNVMRSSQQYSRFLRHRARGRGDAKTLPPRKTAVAVAPDLDAANHSIESAGQSGVQLISTLSPPSAKQNPGVRLPAKKAYRLAVLKKIEVKEQTLKSDSTRKAIEVDLHGKARRASLRAKAESPGGFGDSNITSTRYQEVDSPTTLARSKYVLSNKMVEVTGITGATSTQHVDRGTASQSDATERTLSHVAIGRATRPKGGILASGPFRRAAPKIPLHQIVDVEKNLQIHDNFCRKYAQQILREHTPGASKRQSHNVSAMRADSIASSSPTRDQQTSCMDDDEKLKILMTNGRQSKTKNLYDYLELEPLRAEPTKFGREFEQNAILIPPQRALN